MQPFEMIIKGSIIFPDLDKDGHGCHSAGLAGSALEVAIQIRVVEVDLELQGRKDLVRRREGEGRTWLGEKNS